MPTPYLFNGHLQTFCYSLKDMFTKKKDSYAYERTFLKLEDEGQISLDWIIFPQIEQNFNKETPLLAILPGLTGNRQCGYLKVLLREAETKGYKCVVINHRGCADTPLTTRKLQHKK